MGLFRSLEGMVQVKIVSADIPGLLMRISENNIPVDHLQAVDEMTVQAKIYRKDHKKLYKSTQHRGDELTLIGRKGLYWRGKRLAERPLLLLGFTFLLLLSLILPTRILFVRVQGNNTVPSKLIVEIADECGISIFASRRKVRSEKVKNALLSKIPQLQWIGVNTSGCVATISVTEKSVTDQQAESVGRICSIVASRDGIISAYTVLRGNQLCQVGQAVKAGQTLISGYTDCGISIKATRAEGEIYARTLHDLQVVSPVITAGRGQIRASKTKYSLIIGKKLIKLYKDSGISDASCVKIYDEFKLTLPGGYQLPVTLLRETVAEYAFCAAQQSEDMQWLNDASIDYLQSQMIAGQILSQQIQTQSADDLHYLDGKFACLEMIGQVKEEEIIQR